VRVVHASAQSSRASRWGAESGRYVPISKEVHCGGHEDQLAARGCERGRFGVSEAIAVRPRPELGPDGDKGKDRRGTPDSGGRAGGQSRSVQAGAAIVGREALGGEKLCRSV